MCCWITRNTVKSPIYIYIFVTKESQRASSIPYLKTSLLCIQFSSPSSFYHQSSHSKSSSPSAFVTSYLDHQLGPALDLPNLSLPLNISHLPPVLAISFMPMSITNHPLPQILPPLYPIQLATSTLSPVQLATSNDMTNIGITLHYYRSGPFPISRMPAPPRS